MVVAVVVVVDFLFCVFFFNDTATTEIYTLSLHDALPIFICSDGEGLVLVLAKSWCAERQVPHLILGGGLIYYECL